MGNIHSEEPKAKITFPDSSTGNSEKKMSNAKKASVLEKLWLHYYNDVLYSQKIITEEERNKMSRKINER